jgi:citrate synthase
MGIMLGVVAALSTFLNVSQDKDFDVKDPRHREYVAIKVIAKMPTIAAYAFRTAVGLPIVYPKKEYGFIKNFLYMLFHNPMVKAHF